MVDGNPVSMKYFSNPKKNKYIKHYKDFFTDGKPYSTVYQDYDWIEYINREFSQKKKQRKKLGVRFLRKFMDSYLDMMAEDMIENGDIIQLGMRRVKLYMMIGEVNPQSKRYRYIVSLKRAKYTAFIYLGKYLYTRIKNFYVVSLSHDSRKKWIDKVRSGFRYQRIPIFVDK